MDTHTHVISDDLELYPLQVADYPGVEWVYEAPVTAEELLAALALLARDRGEVPLQFQLLDCPMLDDRQITPSSQINDLVIWTR